MGNISDALEKAGVGLGEETTEERPVTRAEQKEEVLKERQAEQVVVNELPADENSSMVPQDTETVISKRQPVYKQPQIVDGRWDERVDMVANRSSYDAEAFRMLRSRILFPEDGRDRPQTIMIASSAQSEGKSFVATNLAVALARGVDQFCLLVDCDLRRPNVADLFGIPSTDKLGLSEYLREDCELSDVICKTSVDKLSLLPGGESPENPAELMTSARMGRLINELSGRYGDRLIIFDSPPFQAASESIVLAQKVDAVVLVVGYGNQTESG